MRRLIGRSCIFLGIVLLACAAALQGYNAWEARHAMEEAGSILTEIRYIRKEIPEEETEATGEEISGVSEAPAGETDLPFHEPSEDMKVVQIGGYGYIGTLSVPVLELELPVMSELDYARLKISPCRQQGSVHTGDLVIAAHNYGAHFGKLSSLRSGDLLTFTDMEENTFAYRVEAVEVLEPTAVDEVLGSPFDLVLYTCTYGGEKRVVVFCNRLYL